MRIHHLAPLLLLISGACSDAARPDGASESREHADVGVRPSVGWVDAGGGEDDLSDSADTLASADTPALPQPDAAPPGDGSYWTLEPVDVDFMAACWLVMGLETAPLEAFIPIYRVCEFPGPVRATPDGPHRLRIEAWRWIQQGVECEGVTGQATRLVPLHFSEPGEWTLSGNRFGETLEVQVSVVEGDGRLEEGSDCQANSDCRPGAECLPVLYHGSCGLIAVRCAESCSHTFGYSDYVPIGSDCAPDQVCRGDYQWLCDQEMASNPWCGEMWRDNLDSLQTCVPREEDVCTDDADCPRGMGCMGLASGLRVCDWTVSLDQETRVPCTDSGDCAAGLECVENAAGDRRCELRCHTAETRCPAGLSCVAESSTGMPWVCD